MEALLALLGGHVDDADNDTSHGNQCELYGDWCTDGNDTIRIPWFW